MKIVLVELILVSVSYANLPAYSWALKLFKSKIIQIINEHVAEEECASDLKSLMLNSDSKLSAIEMVDASGKLYPGLLRGNLHLFGNFDQCLSINETDHERIIKGQYCTVLVSINKNFLENMSSLFDLRLFELRASNIYKIFQQKIMLNFDLNSIVTKNTMIPFGLCVPQSCSTSNLKNLAQVAAKLFRIPVETAFIDDLCLHKDKTTEIRNLDLFLYFFFGLVFLLVITSTIYEVYLRSSGQTGSSFIIFSVHINVKKLLSRSSNDINLSCLNGIRVLCSMWIVLSYTYLLSIFFSKNALDIFAGWGHHALSGFIWNAFYSVDSFFTISGLLVSYFYFKRSDSERNVLGSISFCLKRFIRQTPSMLAVVFLHTSVLKLLADGPYGFLAVKVVTHECYNTWWHSFFYFIESPNSLKCAQHLWYLFVDSQLYLYSHVILFFIKKHPKPVMGAMFSAFLLWVVYYVVTIINNKVDTLFSLSSYDHLYTSKLHRLPSWVIGMFTGYLFHCSIIRIPRALNVLLWIISLYTIIKLIVNKTDLFNDDQSAAWKGSIQSTWSLALCYIIYSCGTKNGGFINDFLSHPTFRVLGRLTYSIYLIQMAVLLIFFSSQKESAYFNNLQIISTFITLLIIIVPCALLLYLGFEAPMIALKDRKKKIDSLSLTLYKIRTV